MRDYTLINGDLLEADVTFICHQVNCQGKMNSGVAKAIRNKWNKVYDLYSEYCSVNDSSKILGNIQIVGINNSMHQHRADWKEPSYCINMFAQEYYGYDGKQYTSLEAFKKCLEKINYNCAGRSVAFPWMIGCVRGGADWNKVLPMIRETLKDVSEIYFYKL